MLRLLCDLNNADDYRFICVRHSFILFPLAITRAPVRRDVYFFSIKLVMLVHLFPLPSFPPNNMDFTERISHILFISFIYTHLCTYSTRARVHYIEAGLFLGVTILCLFFVKLVITDGIKKQLLGQYFGLKSMNSTTI